MHPMYDIIAGRSEMRPNTCEGKCGNCICDSVWESVYMYSSYELNSSKSVEKLSLVKGKV